MVRRWSAGLALSLVLAVSLFPLVAGATFYQQVTLKASSATTATAASTGVDLVTAVYSTDNRHEGSTVAIYLDITAVTGTNPTLDVKIQCSPDNTTWFDPASTAANRDSLAFAQKTTTGTDVKLVPNVACRYIREYHTIGGTSTPTFTYSVKADIIGGDQRTIAP
ncbi:MAG: hypothetical protein EPN22_17240 [Nitrospirae bacterium]|nr:MAG: hypothetical protein EPN22_17240 [Nitrospirota bacterium]